MNLLEARFEGARYAPLGRGPVYFDCWGLVLEARRLLRLPVPLDPMEAALAPSDMPGIIARHLAAGDWRPAPETDGAIVMFPSLARALHCGVWVAGGVLDISAAAGLRFREANRVRPLRREVVEWAR
ncbi:MAG: hypothetical protein C0421_05665 [Hyphomonas sp.]|uniref:hypothetical protein n=1 Tax=Hyphomonas sp. TaxID=87 RepID=UPI0025C20A8F|nr:hypothetical protein [Hyphomonas sp.]MBA4338314.1 hypothetical protein [Hyphomonas sp.]